MNKREAAEIVSDELLEREKISNSKKILRLKKRYAAIFGEDIFEDCISNSKLAEHSIKESRKQWQVILFTVISLLLTVSSVFFGHTVSAFVFAISGGLIFKRVSNYYARRIYLAARV